MIPGLLLAFALPESLVWIPSWGSWAKVVYAAGVPVDTIPVAYTPESLLDSLFLAGLQSRNTRGREGGGEGLIPDITIPVHLPGFGNLEETSSLQVRGSQNLSFSFSQNYNTNPSLQEAYGGVASFPEIELDQSLLLSLTGTIGRKISVQIDHNSEIQDNTKNTIRLRYTGDEDEIVKLLEAGNTELRLPLTMQYAAFSAGGGAKKGLFGLRGELQLGPVQLAFVATRQQGQSQSRELQAGGTVTVDTLFARDYERDRFFYLGETRPIQKLEVYLDDQNVNNDNDLGARTAEACFYDLDGTPDFNGCEEGQFHRLLESSGDYVFYRSSNVIELRNVPQTFRLAVYYITEDGDTIGAIPADTSQPMRLKLIRPLLPSIEVGTHRDSVLWFLQLRNVYQLYPETEASDIVDLQVTIYRDSAGVLLPGENGKTYLEILGLDPDGDGVVNETVIRDGQPITVLDRARGLLFFPDPLPFARADLNAPDSVIYFKDQLQFNEGTRYRLVVRYVTRSREIQLPFNVLEGSVRVIANGRPLQEGVDYEVNYDFGVVRIINPEILQDTSIRLSISYDYGETFSLMQTSLLGMSLFSTTPDSSLSLAGVFLYRGQSTRDLRPSWDGGPARNLVADLRLEGGLAPLWLRRIRDLFPANRNLPRAPGARRERLLTFAVEGARSFPNPNTLGRAFVDDMESRSLTLSFPVTYGRAWKWGSPPEDRDTSELARSVFWAVPDNFFLRGDIFPNLPTPQQRNERAPVLMWVVDPIHPGDTTNWASLNTVLDLMGVNLTNYEFLDVVVRGDDGVLWVDLATNLNENSIRRNCRGEIVGADLVLETEDRNRNGLLDPGEDTGLDGVAGDDGAGVPGDDCNDDYRFDLSDYSRTSGTENNGGRPDTEDLNENGQLDLTSDYISLPVPLDPALYDVYGVSPYAEVNGWKFFRIPLRSALMRRYGSYFLETAVRFGRLRWQNFTRKDTLFLAKLDVVGNDWRRQGIVDEAGTWPVDTAVERFAVGTVSTDETPDYTPPPDAVRLRLADGTLESERSTSLLVQNLRPGHLALLYRDLTDRRQNYRNYRKLKLWVRPRTGASPPYGTFVFRVGTDSLRYYEIRVPLEGGWQAVWLDLDRLPRLKDSLRNAGGGDTLRSGALTIVGDPNLHAVGYLAFGLANTDSLDLTLEIWVDDIQLLEPRTRAGYATSLQGELNLSPLLRATVQGTFLDDDFVAFESREPGYETRESRTLTLHSEPLGVLTPHPPVQLVLDYQAYRDRRVPRYAPDTDLLIEGDLADRFASTSASSQFQASLRGASIQTGLALPELSYNRRRNLSRGSYTAQEGFSQNLSISWNPRIMRPGWTRLDLRPWPTSLGLQATYTESRTRNQDLRAGTDIRSWKWYYDLGGNVGMQPIKSLSLTYGRSHRFAGYLAPGSRNPPEVSLTESYTAQWSLSLWRILFSPRFSSDYSESRDENPAILATGLRSITRNQRLGGSLTLPTSSLLRFLADLVRRGLPDTTRKVGSPAWLLDQLQRGLSRMMDVGVSLTHTQRLSAGTVWGRPDWRFRLGLARTLPPFDERTFSESRTTTLNLTNLTLSLGRITLNLNPTWSWQRTFTASSASFQDQKTWPAVRVTATLSRPSLPLPPSWRITNLIVNGSLDRTYSVSGTLIPVREEQSRSVNDNLSLDLQASLRNGVRPRFSWTRRTTRQQSLTGGYVVENLSRSSDLNVSFSYTFSRPGGFRIPLSEARVLRMRGNMTLNFSYTRSRQESFASGLPNGSTASTEWNLSARYTFGSGVNGEIVLSKRENRDQSQNVSGSTRLQVNVTFNF